MQPVLKYIDKCIRRALTSAKANSIRIRSPNPESGSRIPEDLLREVYQRAKALVSSVEIIGSIITNDIVLHSNFYSLKYCRGVID